MRAGRTLFVIGFALSAGGCFASFSRGEAEGGTRLRARFLQPEAGEPMFVGWRDTELDRSCIFQLASDGVLRCLPTSLPSSPGLFLDAGCATPVLVASPCRTATWARVPPEGACAGGSSIHEIGEAVSVDGVFTRRADGECVAHEGEIREVQIILDEVPPARFVAAEIRLPADGPERLALTRLVAEDGSQATWGLFDRDRDRRCSPPWEASHLTAAPCVTSFVNPVLMGGAECDEPWANGGETCAGRLEFATREERDTCGHATSMEVFVVGDPVEDPSTPTGCDIWPLAVPHHVTPAPPDAVAWLGRGLRGSARLRRRIWSGEGAEIPIGWSEFAYHDSELDLDCWPSLVASGEVRCVPGQRLDAYAYLGFADPECTVPASVVGRMCGTTHIFSLTRGDGECSRYAIDAVYRITEPIDAIYEDQDGACVSITLDEYREARALELIPMDELARFDEVLE